VTSAAIVPICLYFEDSAKNNKLKIYLKILCFSKAVQIPKTSYYCTGLLFLFYNVSRLVTRKIYIVLLFKYCTNQCSSKGGYTPSEQRCNERLKNWMIVVAQHIFTQSVFRLNVYYYEIYFSSSKNISIESTNFLKFNKIKKL